MADGTMPKPLGDLAGAFLVAMVAGGILLGWLNNRGHRARGDGTSGDGLGSDDGPHHADGGHDGGGDDH